MSWLSRSIEPSRDSLLLHRAVIAEAKLQIRERHASLLRRRDVGNEIYADQAPMTAEYARKVTAFAKHLKDWRSARTYFTAPDSDFRHHCFLGDIEPTAVTREIQNYTALPWNGLIMADRIATYMNHRRSEGRERGRSRTSTG